MKATKGGLAAPTTRSGIIAASNAHRESVANALRTLENHSFYPEAGGFQHDRVSEANAALLDQSFFSEPLTQYAVGWKDSTDLDAALEFFAPEVRTARKFTYAAFDNAEEFLSDGGADDDERPLRADFKEVEYTSTKVDASTKNRGLQICVDLDEIDGDIGDWENHYTGKLMRRIKRNSLRRAVALLSAAAVNTAKTWDTTAGKDPDQDMLAELIAAADLSGIRPNRVGMGDTAWSKRILAHRAQNTAGGFGSAAMTPQQVAAWLAADDVQVVKARYASSATARSQIVGNLVLMFLAEAGMDTEDASNIKRFVSFGNSAQGGGRYQVYTQQVSPKRYIIAVGHYELTKITSTLGIRQFTVS